MLRSIFFVGAMLFVSMPAHATTVSFSKTFFGERTESPVAFARPGLTSFAQLTFDFEGTDVDGDGVIVNDDYLSLFGGPSDPVVSPDVITKATLTGIIFNGALDCDLSSAALSLCSPIDIIGSANLPSLIFLAVSTDLSRILVDSFNGPEEMSLTVNHGSVSGFVDLVYESRSMETRSADITAFSQPHSVPLPASGLFLLSLICLGWMRQMFRARLHRATQTL